MRKPMAYFDHDYDKLQIETRLLTLRDRRVILDLVCSVYVQIIEGSYRLHRFA